MSGLCISTKRYKEYRWAIRHKGSYIQSNSLSMVISYVLRKRTKFLICLIWGHDWDSQFYGYKCRNCGKGY